MKNIKSLFQENPRYEIRIAGSGGQGIILAGIMLAEAAILSGIYAAQSQSYGPESRGGNSISEVILSNTEIDYPRALELDILVALTQEACDRNLPDLKTDGLIVVDSSMVHRVISGNVVSLPFWQIARKVGEERAINMAALGAVVSLCPAIPRSYLVKVMGKRLPTAKVEANLSAFDRALKLARKSRESFKPVTTEEFEI